MNIHPESQTFGFNFLRMTRDIISYMVCDSTKEELAIRWDLEQNVRHEEDNQGRVVPIVSGEIELLAETEDIRIADVHLDLRLASLRLHIHECCKLTRSRNASRYKTQSTGIKCQSIFIKSFRSVVCDGHTTGSSSTNS